MPPRIKPLTLPPVKQKIRYNDMKTLVFLSAAAAFGTDGEHPALNPTAGIWIGIVIGFALAASVFIYLLNKRLKEWKQFYDHQPEHKN